jgi:hypothetical protein
MIPAFTRIGECAGGLMTVMSFAVIVRIRKYIMTPLQRTASIPSFLVYMWKKRPVCIRNWSVVIPVSVISGMKEYAIWNYN